MKFFLIGLLSLFAVSSFAQSDGYKDPYHAFYPEAYSEPHPLNKELKSLPYGINTDFCDKHIVDDLVAGMPDDEPSTEYLVTRLTSPVGRLDYDPIYSFPYDYSKDPMVVRKIDSKVREAGDLKQAVEAYCKD